MMNRLVSLAVFIFAFAGVLVLPGSVQAQQQSQTSGHADFATLVSALSNINSELRALEHEDVQEVRLADVEEIRGGLDEDQTQRLDEAVEKAIEKADIDNLHSTLDKYPAIFRALQEEAEGDVGIQDVVAIDVRGEGVVVVYYEPAP